MIKDTIENDKRDIEEYTKLYPELASADHIVFNEIHPEGTSPVFVVMGINPGEKGVTPRNMEINTENADRQAVKPTPWVNKINYYVGNRPFVMTELFFWSSRNLTQFRERFGVLENSPHLEFCTQKNKKLIRFHKPRAVICPGLGLIPPCKKHFDLELVQTRRRGDGARVCELYKSEDGVPWVFTMHWTGARGFTNQDKLLIKEMIQEVAPKYD